MVPKCSVMRVPWSNLLTLALLGSLLLASLVTAAPRKNKIRDVQEAEDFMKELDARYSHECNLEMKARWEYIVDVMDRDKETAANGAAVRYLNFKGEAAVNSSEFDYSQFESIELYRRFRFLSKQGPGALDSADLTEYKDHQSKMETTYSTATICDYYDPTKCDLTLEPDIEYIMANSENWEELRYVWDQWREVSGKHMKEDFVRFVELSNKAATLDGFSDTGMYWLNGYTVDDREAASFVAADPLSQDQFKDMVDDVWLEVSEELYKKLHSWVRWRMSEIYPQHIDLKGPMPANILGNMWAQDWVNVADHVMPFQEFPSYDVSESMVKNGWDIDQIFVSAQDFFESIGLYPMTQIFWDKSVYNQTEWGKVMLCHASAEDFCLGPDGDDYRIKMCTEVNMEDLVTVHHEMGHIEYFMAYKYQPHVFRDSANPGFHEAIGDLIALSVSTPSHLEYVLHLSPGGVTTAPSASSRYSNDEKRDLNFLMRMALEKIAFLPFGYLIDKFRWGVFDGSIPIDKMNAGWWRLRKDLQGITYPGEPRGEEFFDAGAKYHVPANVPYIRYFVSFIVQFQFQSHLCEVAGHTGPLHTCDIYNNSAAGAVLKDALERGLSEPWPIVLQDLGGSLDMDPKAIISYFDPLIQFLDEELANAGQCIGWGDDCVTSTVDDEELDVVDEDNVDTTTTEPESTGSTGTETEGTETTTESVPSTTTEDPNSEEEARQEMEKMDIQMTEAVHNATLVDWIYETDLKDENKKAAITEWTNVKKSFQPFHHDVINYFNYTTFHSEDLKRQFELQKNLGISALPDKDLGDLTDKISDMATKYSSTVCPANKKSCDKDKDGMGIDELASKMSNNTTNFDDLQYYWEQWRKVSGKEMLEDYKQYITLENKAAEKNGFSNTGLMWIDPYTEEDYNSTDFMSDIAYLWNQTKPLYVNLHAYIRHKLNEKYDEISDDDDLIPAHLLGNMWGETWENLYDLVVPYENVTLLDITEGLEKELGVVSEMADMAEEFFVGIGLFNMTENFKTNSLFEKENKNMVCQASAWDFYDVFEGDFDPQIDGDFRIMMCGGKTQKDFLQIHHEMGHIQYMMAYSVGGNGSIEKMPLVFRDGANPAFHEAVAGTIGLSVSNPEYLLKIAEELNMTLSTTAGPSTTVTETTESDTSETTTEDTTTVTPKHPMEYNTREENGDLEYNTTINFLMKTALSKVAFLPYAYVLDSWRWEVFDDNNTNNDYNKRWWALRIAEQGIAPPGKRYPESDFDPGAKYDVAVSVPYIWRFVANILQFQFHKKLCDAAEIEPPYHKCHIDGILESGKWLRKMLTLGRSQKWQTVLAEFLEQEQGMMDAEALTTYFKPLNDYLETYIKDNNLKTGWDPNQIDKYMGVERAEISSTVPIIVGCVLAVMVVVVIVAYFVGQKKQSKKRRILAAQQEASSGLSNLGMDTEEEEKEKDKDSSDEEADEKL